MLAYQLITTTKEIKRIKALIIESGLYSFNLKNKFHKRM